MTPRRIIIHAGFHKTGTTNLQQTLRANRAALRPDVRLVLRPGMNALCESARGYSISREDYDLGLVKYEAALLMEALERETARTLVISSEDLSGHMPGRHGLRSYGAAPDLMRALSVAIKAVDSNAQVTFFFTTRAADPWLRSCYAQHLRTARMIWDEAEYIKRLKASAALEQIIDQIRSEVPDSDVVAAALEAHANRPLGMAEALLDNLDFPKSRRAKLVPSSTRNAALSADVCTELLALNRSDLEPAALKKAKRAVIDGAN